LGTDWYYPNEYRCGDLIKVTNKENGKSVVVQFSDQCDKPKDGCKSAIDLSKPAFDKLARREKGVIDIKMEWISHGTPGSSGSGISGAEISKRPTDSKEHQRKRMEELKQLRREHKERKKNNGGKPVHTVGKSVGSPKSSSSSSSSSSKSTTSSAPKVSETRVASARQSTSKGDGKAASISEFFTPSHDHSRNLYVMDGRKNGQPLTVTFRYRERFEVSHTYRSGREPTRDWVVLKESSPRIKVKYVESGKWMSSVEGREEKMDCGKNFMQGKTAAWRCVS